MLARALDGVISQARNPAFSIEVVVVDNDKKRSAQELVSRYQENDKYKIIYDCEPEKSIALARNRTICRASGNLIAFIDDDEFPAEDWLPQMYLCLKKYDADGALGPVLPHFPAGAPKWLAKSGICERPRNVTGSPATIKDLRTGNVLLRRRLFEKDGRWFDPALGLTGGSDGQFLWRQLDRGRAFVWCDEAVVFETVGEERWPAEFYLKRSCRIGALQGGLYRRSREIRPVLVTAISFFGYSALLPFSVVGGEHIWMSLLTKIYYNGACLLAFMGLKHAPYRY
jgi:glycosyltransferase involved in cell wall biosynthesis